jgi:hypothetical protein
MVYLLIQIVQIKMGGGPDVQATSDKEIRWTLQITKLLGDEKKKNLWGGSVFISSSRRGVNQMLEIFSSAQDTALYKQSYAS